MAAHGLETPEEAGCARDLLFIWREIYFGGNPSVAAPICIYPYATYAALMDKVGGCCCEWVGGEAGEWGHESWAAPAGAALPVCGWPDWAAFP